MAEQVKSKAKATKAVKPAATISGPRLRLSYKQTIVPELLKQLNLKNPHEVPKVEKVVINVGLGRAKDDKRLMETANNTLRKITGQQPIQTTAKNSIAGFKLREGNKIGLKVTLRGDKMYEFIDRLINLVLPRLRDFHGVSNKAFDKQGNYSIGIIDQSVFSELSFEETSPVHGLQITFVIDSQNKEYSKALLQQFGMPFEKEAK